MLAASHLTIPVLCLLLSCCAAMLHAASPPLPEPAAPSPPRMFVDLSQIPRWGTSEARRRQTAIALRVSGEPSNFDRDSAIDGIAARVFLLDADGQPLALETGTIDFQLQFLRFQPLHTGLEIDPDARPVRWTERADSRQVSGAYLLPFRTPDHARHSGWAILSASTGVPGRGSFDAECLICIPTALVPPRQTP